jgi:hypothetical protein
LNYPRKKHLSLTQEPIKLNSSAYSSKEPHLMWASQDLALTAEAAHIELTPVTCRMSAPIKDMTKRLKEKKMLSITSKNQ